MKPGRLTTGQRTQMSAIFGRRDGDVVEHPPAPVTDNPAKRARRRLEALAERRRLARLTDWLD